MSISKKIFIIFIIIFIAITAAWTFIPIKKYQHTYFKFIKDFRSKPQEHFDKQIEYVNYFDANDDLPQESRQLETLKTNITKPLPPKTDPKNRKPLYIRDKNNPNILHPYKERKFLFFRIYYK